MNKGINIHLALIVLCLCLIGALTGVILIPALDQGVNLSHPITMPQPLVIILILVGLVLMIALLTSLSKAFLPANKKATFKQVFKSTISCLIVAVIIALICSLIYGLIALLLGKVLGGFLSLSAIKLTIRVITGILTLLISNHLIISFLNTMIKGRSFLKEFKDFRLVIYLRLLIILVIAFLIGALCNIIYEQVNLNPLSLIIIKTGVTTLLGMGSCLGYLILYQQTKEQTL